MGELNALFSPSSKVHVRTGISAADDVLYIGGAPGLVQGIFQINVRTSKQFTASGDNEIGLVFDDVKAPNIATVAFR